ncbi:YIP1 family protein [Hazenella coriacea]|uniref:Yip1-like protein n=1 Tax=Hazenella coriacea TaxID=1179467 RepID=A0A4R3L9W1_9BACL|nr:YIP1 family protein [Hazenella coriacea]TCS95915.1 Yip1-like protein [Hazenella coriacea]
MSSPFFSIWLRPRKTIRLIENSRYSNMVLVLVLASLYGIYDVAQSYNPILGDMPLSIKFLPTDQVYLMILNALTWGIVATFLESGIIFLLSRLLYGEAKFRSVFNAVTWSKIPILVDTFFIWLPILLIFGREYFALALPFDWIDLLKIIPLLLSVILNCWYLYVVSQCITEVNKYESGWQGFFVIFSSGFFYIVIYALLLLLF